MVPCHRSSPPRKADRQLDRALKRPGRDRDESLPASQNPGPLVYRTEFASESERRHSSAMSHVCPVPLKNRRGAMRREAQPVVWKGMVSFFPLLSVNGVGLPEALASGLSVRAEVTFSFMANPTANEAARGARRLLVPRRAIDQT